MEKKHPIQSQLRNLANVLFPLFGEVLKNREDRLCDFLSGSVPARASPVRLKDELVQAIPAGLDSHLRGTPRVVAGLKALEIVRLAKRVD